MLQDRKTYGLQARPCIFHPGNFTGWSSEGVKGVYRDVREEAVAYSYLRMLVEELFVTYITHAMDTGGCTTVVGAFELNLLSERRAKKAMHLITIASTPRAKLGATFVRCTGSV